jgi:hypothetical protein
MTVTEYHDRFLQLARYAPADVAIDSDKQEYFKEGLDDDIQYALLNLRFDSFNHLVDAALNTERKCREIAGAAPAVPAAAVVSSPSSAAGRTGSEASSASGSTSSEAGSAHSSCRAAGSSTPTGVLSLW